MKLAALLLTLPLSACGFCMEHERVCALPIAVGMVIAAGHVASSPPESTARTPTNPIVRAKP